MCGRAAQTLSAVQAAASTFRVVGNVNDHLHQNRNSTGNSNNHHDGVSSSITATSAKYMNHAMMVHESNNSNDIDGMKDTVAADNMKRSDNYNMSPGMDAIVFWVDHSNSKNVTTTTTATSTTGSNAIHPKIQMKRMTWGLLSQNGTTSKPLEKGMNKHFTNLMYNARSDTLYEKVTFHNLCSKKQSCIIALDGYFEWKTEMGKKQPYFVYRNKKSTTRSTTSVSGDNHPQQQQQQQQQHSYLLLAGLWKRTITGWSDEPSIDTFTMLTTEVCPAIQWLHTRMPVLIWDHNLAIQWLQNPASKAVHDQLVYQSQQTNHEQLQWHKVITSMSSMKFRTIEAILPYKDKQQSVKSFFTKSVPSSTTKTKDDSDDDVVEVLSSDQFHNNNIKKAEDNISETAEQRPIVRETTASTPTKKRTVGDDPTVATKLITTNNHSASTKRKKNNPSSTTPSKPSIMNSNNTRTIDSFFTPKSTRK